MHSSFDGIIGLAFPKMDASNLEPLFDNIISQGNLGKNIFSFYYNRRPETRYSAMVVGDVNSDFYEGEMNYYPVVDEYYWSIKAD